MHLRLLAKTTGLGEEIVAGFVEFIGSNATHS